MSWRERRLITVLSAILAVLSAAVLIVLGIRYRENRAAAQIQDPAALVVEAAAEVGGKYVALEYFNGATTLAFDFTEEGKWVWRYDHDFPLDDTTVNAILDTVTDLRPQQTLTEPEPLENYGLDSPDATITVTTVEQTYITVTFGKSTTDGDSYYALLNGETDTVYIFADTLLNHMKTPIYDMCVLPELPDLTDLRSVTLFGSGGTGSSSMRITKLTARQSGRGNALSWYNDDEEVTDSPTVQALLEDIRDFSIDRCVDYNPSDDAAVLCGFENPTARVTIDYTGEDGEEASLLLYVANPLPDSSGRYVRIGEDTTIYYLPTALLDPMMRLAVNGLDD